jgi:hypothetical protein
MARRKNLTALAALGTLGYMLSKRGDKKDEKPTTAAAERRIAADKVASEEPLKVGDEFGMDPEEAANKRTERMLTNPNAREFGEAGTSMTVSPSKKPSAAKNPAKPSSGAAKNLTASESQAARNALGEGSYRQDSVYSPDRRGVTSETRAPRFTPNEPPVQTHFGSRDEENAPRGKIDVTKYSLEDRRKMPSDRAPTDYRAVKDRFRRGGAVKGYASGGSVSSASKRADGIATKGKTRGKMY